MIVRILRSLCLLLLTGLAACLADPPVLVIENSPVSAQSALKLEILHSSSQCGPALATQWISSQEQFEKLLLGTQSMMISSSPQQAPTVDFTQSAVLFVSMGQQRSAGYGLRLAREEMQIKSGSAEIIMQWQEPQPGMMVAQVITHPCVFIKFPLGDYQLVRVVDQNNTLRAEITVR